MIEIIFWGLLLLLILIIGLMFFSVVVAYASQIAYRDPNFRHCPDCSEQDCFECSCDRDCCEGK